MEGGPSSGGGHPGNDEFNLATRKAKGKEKTASRATNEAKAPNFELEGMDTPTPDTAFGFKGKVPGHLPDMCIEDILFKGAGELTPDDGSSRERPDNNVRPEGSGGNGRRKGEATPKVKKELPIHSRPQEAGRVRATGAGAGARSSTSGDEVDKVSSGWGEAVFLGDQPTEVAGEGLKHVVVPPSIAPLPQGDNTSIKNVLEGGTRLGAKKATGTGVATPPAEIGGVRKGPSLGIEDEGEFRFRHAKDLLVPTSYRGDQRTPLKKVTR